jgi:hypothetical protein
MTNLDLQNTTLGYGFHFQHRNPRTLPIKSFVHDSGLILARAKYGYPKGSPNTNIYLQTPTAKEEICHYSSQYSARLNAHPNDLIEQPDNRRLERHLSNHLPDRFLV